MTDQKIDVPMPGGGMAKGIDVPVDESNERWSEYKLKDGSVVRCKMAVVSVVRLDGQYDENDLPLYAVKSIQVAATVSAPDSLKKKK